MTRTLPLAALLAAALVGCDPPKRTSPPVNSGPPPKGPMTAGMGGSRGEPKEAKDGKDVVQTRGCLRCHTIGEAGGKKGKGPDLSHVGADAKHTKEWLAAYVKDPKGTNPDSKMPAHPNLSEKELDMLADYLVGLK